MPTLYDIDNHVEDILTHTNLPIFFLYLHSRMLILPDFLTCNLNDLGHIDSNHHPIQVVDIRDLLSTNYVFLIKHFSKNKDQVWVCNHYAAIEA